MKGTKNSFSSLGLDPHILRGLPDETAAQIIRSVFRSLISHYHDDRRNQILDAYNSARERKKFDDRRDEIMAAFERLSTPQGRMEEMQSFKKSSAADLKAQIEEQRLDFAMSLGKLCNRELSLILDRVGALQAEEHTTPINQVWGGGILTYTSGPSFFSFQIGDAALVTELKPCKVFPSEKIVHPKKQRWFLEGTSKRDDGYAVEGKPMPFPAGLTVLGSVEDEYMGEEIFRVPKALLGSFLPPKPGGFPFQRLHSKYMERYLYLLRPSVSNGHLVLVDSKGIFYFAGFIRSTLRADELKRH